MRPISRRFFVFCLAAAALVGTAASGQNDKSLVGTWSMISQTGGDPVPWTLTFKQVDGKLTASVDDGDGEKPAQDFTSAGGMLKFTVTYKGADYNIELKATTDKLNGTWSGGGDSGKLRGRGSSDS